MNPITTANAEFCLDVFKELSSSNAGENIFFSPLTVFYALSMLLLGARGKSAEQMEKVRVGGERPQNPGIFMFPPLVYQVLFIKIPSCEMKRHT